VTTPLVVALHDGQLQVSWPELDARFAGRVLREACRCAECSAQARLGNPVDVDETLRVVDVTPIGAYAVQLTFSDGHQRGVYPWAMLHALALRAQT